MRTPVLYLLLLTLFTACTREAAEEEHPPLIPVDFAMSRDAADGEEGSYHDVTYRVLLYDAVTNAYTGYSGTYCNPAANHAWLTPCTVNTATGAWQADDSSAGLSAPAGNYNMVLVSPAADMTAIPNLDSQKGYPYHREGSSPALHFSDTIPVAITGILTGGKYIYTVPGEKKLTERQARIKIQIGCGKDVPTEVLAGVSVANVIGKGYYRPQTLNFHPANEGMITIEKLVALPVVLTNNGTYHSIPQTADEYILLPSQDYAKIDAFGQLINPTPVLRVTLGSVTSKTVDIPLSYTNMLPLHTYTYKITINAVHVAVSLGIAPWTDNPGVDDSIESFPLIPLGTFKIEDWHSGGGGTDVIQ